MSKLDEIFENVAARITADVPTHNYLVKVENVDQIKQDVKELFTNLGNKHINNPKDAAKWRRKVAEL